MALFLNILNCAKDHFDMTAFLQTKLTERPIFRQDQPHKSTDVNAQIAFEATQNYCR